MHVDRPPRNFTRTEDLRISQFLKADAYFRNIVAGIEKFHSAFGNGVNEISSELN